MTTAPRDPAAQSRGDAAGFVLPEAALEIHSRDPAETIAIGKALAGCLRDGDVVLLHGDLGAGKTMLAKGIAAALGVKDVVSSPSFSLVNEYDICLAATVTRLFHLDLYRLQGEEDLASIGFDDFVAPTDGVSLVEWPERAATALPEHFLLIEIESVGSVSRLLRFIPGPDGDSWTCRLESIRAHFASSADSGDA